MGQKGIAHYILPLILIVGVGIIGVAFVAIDHADPNTVNCNTVLPPTPTGFTATKVSGQYAVDLSWNPVTPAKGCTLLKYVLYRDGSKYAGVQTDTTNFGDMGLAANTKYSYFVASQYVSESENESEPSNSASVTTIPSSELNPAYCVNRKFVVGDPYSICVEYAQHMLNSLNTYFTQYAKTCTGTATPAQLKIDGLFGLGTSAQVQRWQCISNIGVGPVLWFQTWYKLCNWDTVMWNDVKNQPTIPKYITDSVTYANAAQCQLPIST